MGTKKILYVIVFCLLFFNISIVVLNAADRINDTIYDEKENSVYLVGWHYSRLTGNNVQGYDTIYKIDIKSGAIGAYYKNNRIDRLNISADMEYIAILRRDASQLTRNDQIVIIDKQKKKVIAKFKDAIRSYMWSPDSKKIIYIAGIKEEGREMNPDGVWIYDIEERKKKKIANGAMNVEWYNINEIYLIYSSMPNYETLSTIKLSDNTRIYGYNEGKILHDNVKGFKYSLDGQFTLSLRPDIQAIMMMGKIQGEILIEIFNLKKEKIIPRKQLDHIFHSTDKIMWEHTFWLANKRLVVVRLIPKESFNDFSICDIENNKILKKFKGRLVGTNSNRNKIVVYQDDRFNVIDVP